MSAALRFALLLALIALASAALAVRERPAHAGLRGVAPSALR
ncbi:MAG TPA: hypothetical protein VMU58_08975 [Gaiellaceae bacterium]|nr:hypothetical protein [Gaiellaceae bacterium]